MASEDHIEAGEGQLGAIGTASISRREMLKKGAIVGGAVVWAVPAVELVGTRVAAAQSHHLEADCKVKVPGVSTFRPTGTNKTTIVITYVHNKDPFNYLTETVYVSSGGVVTTSPSSNPEFTFTLSSDGSTLSTNISGSDTIEIVSVVVNDVNYGQLSGFYSNCNPFLIVAVH
ncbi:hypothetical protein GHK86_05835 [Acidimicrobiaceae bacterium USS-CC1]|uniref:Twin-arginine translocation signal domain-containing protein n=1 Tax=Acidiferrimicrobium australe TaxID=2664430 RepID=A0ABW9QV31_9ACTN|nr:hypothetical protein [Acidiferrimicrobium australe]